MRSITTKQYTHKRSIRSVRCQGRGLISPSAICSVSSRHLRVEIMKPEEPEISLKSRFLSGASTQHMSEGQQNLKGLASHMIKTICSDELTPWWMCVCVCVCVASSSPDDPETECRLKAGFFSVCCVSGLLVSMILNEPCP